MRNSNGHIKIEVLCASSSVLSKNQGSKKQKAKITGYQTLSNLPEVVDRRNTMLQLKAKSLEMRTPQATKTAVLVIGGAEDKVHGREILRTFFGRAGASKAYITIIPSASREPAIIGGRYIRIFEEMGAEKVEILDIREREQCENPQIRASLEACSGVFLT
jgi:cyanophycinase